MSPVRPDGEVADITKTHWGVLIARLEEVAKSIDGIVGDDCLTLDEEATLQAASERVGWVVRRLQEEAQR